MATELRAEELIRVLYRTLLLREPDEAGLRHHLQLFERHVDFDATIRAFLGSREFSQNLHRFQQRFVDPEVDPAGDLLILDQSQFGEVGLLIRAMVNDAATHRIVVDVGARGRERSNSFDLLRHFGWKGLLIEANPALIEGIEREFGGLDVTILNVAVSDYSGEGTLHLGVNDDVSAITEANARAWGETRGQVAVRVERLGDLLRRHDIPVDFDLLSLDIEGEDVRVFNDTLEAGYRPRWVIIEAAFDGAVRSLDDLPLSATARETYKIVARTAPNLILGINPAYPPGAPDHE